MHGAIPRDKHAVADFHITAQQSAIGKDDMVPELAVMADVGSRHEKIMVADRGCRRWGSGAMDLHVLTKNIMVANMQEGLRARVGLVLRRTAQHSTWMDFVVFADIRPAGEAGVRHHAGATFDSNAPFDNNVRTDLDVAVDLGFGVNHRGGMNRHRSVELLVFILVVASDV